MLYTPPSITATYAAASVIRSEKGDTELEVNQITLTNNAAYQSDE
jgi:hypothetical protein